MLKPETIKALRENGYDGLITGMIGLAANR